MDRNRHLGYEAPPPSPSEPAESQVEEKAFDIEEDFHIRHHEKTTPARKRGGVSDTVDKKFKEVNKPSKTMKILEQPDVSSHRRFNEPYGEPSSLSGFINKPRRRHSCDPPQS